MKPFKPEIKKPDLSSIKKQVETKLETAIEEEENMHSSSQENEKEAVELVEEKKDLPKISVPKVSKPKIAVPKKVDVVKPSIPKKPVVKPPKIAPKTEKEDTEKDSVLEENKVSERTDDHKRGSKPEVDNKEIDVLKEEKKDEISMEEIPVTRDGRTIDEVIDNMFPKARKQDKKLEDLTSVVSEKGKRKKKTSKPEFTKALTKAEQEAKADKKRKAAAKRFVQKNARYTEQQKIIMKNLGLTPEGFKEVMKTDELTRKDKEWLLDAGSKGVVRHFKGKRFRTTPADSDVIEFLAKFKFANTRILNRMRNEDYSRTWRRLDRLREKGIVGDTEIIGQGTIWYLTETGMALSGYDFTPYNYRKPQTSTMPPTIGANNVAASLWNNQYDFLFLEDFPAQNRTVYKNGVESKVYGENLVSELEIRSSLGKETQPSFGNSDRGVSGNAFAVAGEQAQLIWHEWEQSGRPVDSPEMEIGNEYLWVLFPSGQLSKSYHVPDLVIKRERDDDGSPNSIAVEIELNTKTFQKYVETMTAFQMYTHLYKSVIWVTNNNKTSRLIEQAAESIGFEDYQIVPVMNQHGVYKDKDIWNV